MLNRSLSKISIGTKMPYHLYEGNVVYIMFLWHTRHHFIDVGLRYELARSMAMRHLGVRSYENRME